MECSVDHLRRENVERRERYARIDTECHRLQMEAEERQREKEEVGEIVEGEEMEVERLKGREKEVKEMIAKVKERIQAI
jgi:hypothetical protein